MKFTHTFDPLRLTVAGILVQAHNVKIEKESGATWLTFHFDPRTPQAYSLRVLFGKEQAWGAGDSRHVLHCEHFHTTDALFTHYCSDGAFTMLICGPLHWSEGHAPNVSKGQAFQDAVRIQTEDLDTTALPNGSLDAGGLADAVQRRVNASFEDALNELRHDPSSAPIIGVDPGQNKTGLVLHDKAWQKSSAQIQEDKTNRTLRANRDIPYISCVLEFIPTGAGDQKSSRICGTKQAIVAAVCAVKGVATCRVEEQEAGSVRVVVQDQPGMYSDDDQVAQAIWDHAPLVRYIGERVGMADGWPLHAQVRFDRERS